MFTVCPKCTLTLAVTAADLRTGQGYVRCGRCLNVFNALLGLSEEPAEGGAAAPTYSQADPASALQISAALASSANDAANFNDAGQFDAAAEPVEAAETAEAAEYHGHAPDPAPRSYLYTERSSDGAIENESSLAEGTGSFETIVLEGDTISQTEEFVPEESVDHEIAALTQRLSEAQHEREESAAGVARAAPGPAAPASAAIDADQIVVATPARRGRWIAGCIVLVLLLAVQAINHWRDALASSPLFSAPIESVYSRIGIPLDPRWNLGGYDVRQQGASADPGDSHVIRVRLSVANREQRAQPAPLLRLTLLDRYGKPIAARDLVPAEYWPAGHPARGVLAHDERIDSEVALRDPAADSASFELDVCLKSARGVVRCASDTTAAPAPIP
jgi:predicted Zn finger-like uncharacterized protein